MDSLKRRVRELERAAPKKAAAKRSTAKRSTAKRTAPGSETAPRATA
jgi:hypothetical protein